MWRKTRLVVVYALAAAGVVAPFWSAGVTETGIAVHGLQHIQSYGPVVPTFSRFFVQNAGWFISGSKLLTALGILSAILVYRFQRDTQSRALGILGIGAFGYHLALMNLAAYVTAFFVLPAVANGA